MLTSCPLLSADCVPDLGGTAFTRSSGSASRCSFSVFAAEPELRAELDARDPDLSSAMFVELVLRESDMLGPPPAVGVLLGGAMMAFLCDSVASSGDESSFKINPVLRT